MNFIWSMLLVVIIYFIFYISREKYNEIYNKKAIIANLARYHSYGVITPGRNWKSSDTYCEYRYKWNEHNVLYEVKIKGTPPDSLNLYVFDENKWPISKYDIERLKVTVPMKISIIVATVMILIRIFIL